MYSSVKLRSACNQPYSLVHTKSCFVGVQASEIMLEKHEITEMKRNGEDKVVGGQCDRRSIKGKWKMEEEEAVAEPRFGYGVTAN